VEAMPKMSTIAIICRYLFHGSGTALRLHHQNETHQTDKLQSTIADSTTKISVLPTWSTDKQQKQMNAHNCSL